MIFSPKKKQYKRNNVTSKCKEKEISDEFL